MNAVMEEMAVNDYPVSSQSLGPYRTDYSHRPKKYYHPQKTGSVCLYEGISLPYLGQVLSSRSSGQGHVQQMIIIADF